MELDLFNQKTRNFLKFIFGFIAFSGLINFIFLLLMPADGKNAILLGYSYKRLAILAFLIFGSILSIIEGVKISQISQGKFQAIINLFMSRGMPVLLIVFFYLAILLVWLAGFSPEYFLGDYYAIGRRLLPVLIWLMSIGVAALGICIFLRKSTMKNSILSDRKHWRLFAVTTAVLILIFLFIAWIYPKLTDRLWFGRFSVPILATQIFAAWIITSFVMFLIDRFLEKIPSILIYHSDIIFFFLIWIISAVLWVNQPIEFMGDMYSTTIEQHIKPLPPNFEIYPRKDSLIYYTISESIVTGRGIYRSIDKSLFLAFEGLNNWLTGGSYEKMLNFQTILLASFPAVIYLLGSKIHSQSAGLLAASLAVMQEINGIHLMDEFPVVSSKVLLSEPFMQFWTAIIALSGFLAFRRSKNQQASLFLILGGSLGLSALFRLNTAVVIPFILLMAFIDNFRDRKALVRSIAIFLVGLAIALSPWMIHNAIKYGDPLAFIKAKVSGVIIKNRYEKITNKADTSNNLEYDVIDTFSVIVYTRSDDGISSGEFLEKSINFDMSFAGFINPRDQITSTKTLSNIPQILVSIFRHSLNNIITSFSILPTTLTPQDLFHGSRSQKFWGVYDPVEYEGINPVVLIINILILSVGIASVYSKHRTAGLLPMAIFLGYHLSNGMAISSGNRYTQPVSWVIFFYFAIGLIVISKILFHLVNHDSQLIKSKLNKDKKNLKRNGFILACFCLLLIGSAPVAADLLPINRFPKYSQQQLISLLTGVDNINQTTASNSFKEIIRNNTEKKLITNYGRILNPIYVNNEEHKLVYGKANFEGDNRYLRFLMLEPGTKIIEKMVFYPQNEQIAIENKSDVIFIYRKENKSEILAIGIIDPAFSSQISTYKNISQIPLSNFYLSDHFSE